MTVNFGSSCFHVLCFIGITKEPSFISKRRVPYYDPQISKYLEWNGTVRENDALAPPEPQIIRTPKPQEAEQREDANHETVLPQEASRVPKRTRSHSADSRAEGASDGVEKHQDVTKNHSLVNADVELRPSTKPLPESIEPRVGRATLFLLQSIFKFFLLFVLFLSCVSDIDASRLLRVSEKGSILTDCSFVRNVLRHAIPTWAFCLSMLVIRDSRVPRTRSY